MEEFRTQEQDECGDVLFTEPWDFTKTMLAYWT